MVELMNSGNILPESEAQSGNKFPVKSEVESSLDEEHGRLSKRSKLSSSFRQQWSMETNAVPFPPSQYNPLDEPSPLGLRLKKSPSFLDLIQMRLTQGNPLAYGERLDLGKNDLKGAAGLGSTEKLKASNFPASLLRIGSWECVSRYEGDLVAKCYYAKHKLVWEVLEGGLKSKIEIQWSDIMALKASCPDKGPGTLDVVLARQPLFYRETNPQPRKHTLWQATSDFTGEQASVHRRHFLQCPQGILNKHFEKLIQCDPRLNLLSQQPEILLESPYFDLKASVFEDQIESNSHEFDSRVDDGGASSSMPDAVSPSVVQSSSMKNELLNPVSREPEHLSREAPSPSSVMDNTAMEENRSNESEERKGLSPWDQLRVPGIHPSMSMSDLVSHIGQCISDQKSAGNPLFSGKETGDILEDITQYLLSDSHSAASDEKCLMSRVNSLCCLLQKDSSTAQNLPIKCDGSIDGFSGGRNGQLNPTFKSSIESKATVDLQAPEGESGNKQALSISRKDSVGDLLLHLPRIASLPQFLFNISEDVDNQAR